MTSVKENTKIAQGDKPPMDNIRRLKLIQGAAGIYFFFIQYGRLQEKMFQYVSPEGTKFNAVWFLQFLDALGNVLVAGVGRQFQGSVRGLPQHFLATSGLGQVLSKYCLSASLAAGLSFPVATLAKSAKMVPVMIGSLILGGATFSFRQVSQAAAIVGGTSIVNLAEGGKKGKSSSSMGLLLVCMALGFDGVVAGVQKMMKKDLKEKKLKEKPYDSMFWTNFYMMLVAAVCSVVKSEMAPGIHYLRTNPNFCRQIVTYALCGAMGQSCIFYTITNFDPVICTAVTTTRKLVSVLISLFSSGTQLPPAGWAGISLAAVGICGEII